MSKEAKYLGLKKPKDLPVKETEKIRGVNKSKPTNKHLLDRLNAARKAFLWELDWEQSPHAKLLGYGRYYEKRYEAALKACLDAGIEVKA